MQTIPGVLIAAFEHVRHDLVGSVPDLDTEYLRCTRKADVVFLQCTFLLPDEQDDDAIVEVATLTLTLLDDLDDGQRFPNGKLEIRLDRGQGTDEEGNIIMPSIRLTDHNTAEDIEGIASVLRGPWLMHVISLFRDEEEAE